MAHESAPSESSKSKAIKVSVLVVILLAAGYLFYRSRTGDGGQPDDLKSATPYVCPADGATLNVTAASFDKMLRTGEVGPPEGTEAVGRARSGFFVRCPTCKKRVMVEGLRCEKDGTVFRKVGADQKPGACPKCGWKPAAQ
jgi:hypothetical protein